MPQERIFSLDALRGTVMVLMAVDHAGYFIAKHHPAEYWGIPMPRYHDAFEFLTRLITHPCAPGFFFLMGTGMALLAASRRNLGWTEGRIAGFLVKRGGLLVAMELMVLNLAWWLGEAGFPSTPCCE
jgi:uncharacterized membrane protein